MPQYEIIQRHDNRPWESIGGPYWDRERADTALSTVIVRAPGVEYRVVPVGIDARTMTFQTSGSVTVGVPSTVSVTVN